jgi:hypothetical protein
LIQNLNQLNPDLSKDKALMEHLKFFINFNLLPNSTEENQIKVIQEFVKKEIKLDDCSYKEFILIEAESRRTIEYTSRLKNISITEAVKSIFMN